MKKKKKSKYDAGYSPLQKLRVGLVLCVLFGAAALISFQFLTAERVRETEECLPWSMLSVGVSTRHFIKEREQAYLSRITPDCRVQCTGCGASKLTGGICDAEA